MIRLVWLFLVVAAIAAAAAALSGQPGEVSIRMGAMTVAMHPAVAAALAIAAVAVLMALWRFLGLILDWPQAMSLYRRDKRRRATYLALAKGMVAVSAGDAASARRHQAKARAGENEPLLGQLLSAQIAQLEGDEDGATRTYADMLGRPETEFLGLRGLFAQALRRGDLDSARRYAARAYDLRPQTPWVTAALFDLGARAGQWKAAGTLIDAQVRRKQLTFDAGRRRKAVLAAAEAQDLLAAGKAAAALAQAKEALRTAPGLLPAALAGAEALRRDGRASKAAALLERAWTAEPHPAIAEAYGPVSQQTHARRFDRLIAARPEHAESHLLSALQTAEQGRMREAEGLLAPLLAPQPIARACRLMADLALAQGDREGAAIWSERALLGPPLGRWRCASCDGDEGEWSAVCPRCGAFDTLSWSDPGAPVESVGDILERRASLWRLPPPPEQPAAPRLAAPTAEPDPPDGEQRT